jgi:hypothetical protein
MWFASIETGGLASGAVAAEVAEVAEEAVGQADRTMGMGMLDNVSKKCIGFDQTSLAGRSLNSEMGDPTNCVQWSKKGRPKPDKNKVFEDCSID